MVTIRCGSYIFEGIQAIAFDKDGTLADSHPFLWQLAHQRVNLIAQQFPGVEADLLQAFGVRGDRLDLAGLMAVGTRPENEIAAAAYLAARGCAWQEAKTITQKAFIQADQQCRKADHTPPFADIRELLTSLHHAGVAIAVLSGDSTPNVQDFLARYELTAWIQYAAGSTASLAKPDPAFLWQACTALKIEAKATLVIGDATTDLELANQARAAGSIGVTWGGAAQTDLGGATAIASKPTDIQIEPSF
ncbi:MAG TPA: HAD family hydrolase [Leptolyngbyaceae cyanobacterium M33_DOE_097]|uniref:HAD family hydrolase n=1 Tax=Oscillatoriales cyanobacterium SpSt-418 TaxID=2282169 RepID=A0A7C3PGA2_9CYAN|nr:HAD family hydrolase [Leptolyngbyaceae cyanobacterium M33_DOE_097]